MTETAEASPSMPITELPSQEKMAVVYTIEETRLGTKDKEELRAAIAELDTLIFSLDRLAEAQPEQITGLLQAVRLKVVILMKLYSLSPEIGESTEWLKETKTVLEGWHLADSLKAAAADKTTGLRGEKYFFTIELARDVAKYLSKLADLSGNKEYWLLAGRILQAVPMSAEVTIDPEADVVPLAQFEQLIYTSLGGEKIDAQKLMDYYRELVKRSKNWDRKAITAWQLFEYGVRHKNAAAIQLGFLSVQAATESGEKSASMYMVERLGSTIAGIKRRAKFKRQGSEALLESLELGQV